MAGILCIQINSILGNKSENINKIEKHLAENKNKNLDMVILPEFFSTNIEYEHSSEDEEGGETIKQICEIAKKYNTNIIAGTIIRKVGQKYFNTSFAINRQGEIIAKYDKIHLYDFMGGNEGSFISAGGEIVTADFDFARVGMAICFDIRYPLHFNKLIKKNVDIIVLPTSWLIPKEVYEYDYEYARDMWISLNRTRAYDNMVYFAVSNQTGKVNEDLYGLGNSMILSPTAEILAKSELEEGSIYAEIELSNVKLLRQIYPIAKID